MAAKEVKARVELQCSSHLHRLDILFRRELTFQRRDKSRMELRGRGPVLRDMPAIRCRSHSEIIFTLMSHCCSWFRCLSFASLILPVLPTMGSRAEGGLRERSRGRRRRQLPTKAGRAKGRKGIGGGRGAQSTPRPALDGVPRLGQRPAGSQDPRGPPCPPSASN